MRTVVMFLALALQLAASVVGAQNASLNYTPARPPQSATSNQQGLVSPPTTPAASPAPLPAGGYISCANARAELAAVWVTNLGNCPTTPPNPTSPSSPVPGGCQRVVPATGDRAPTDSHGVLTCAPGMHGVPRALAYSPPVGDSGVCLVGCYVANSDPAQRWTEDQLREQASALAEARSQLSAQREELRTQRESIEALLTRTPGGVLDRSASGDAADHRTLRERMVEFRAALDTRLATLDANITSFRVDLATLSDQARDMATALRSHRAQINALRQDVDEALRLARENRGIIDNEIRPQLARHEAAITALRGNTLDMHLSFGGYGPVSAISGFTLTAGGGWTHLTTSRTVYQLDGHIGLGEMAADLGSNFAVDVRMGIGNRAEHSNVMWTFGPMITALWSSHQSVGSLHGVGRGYGIFATLRAEIFVEDWVSLSFTGGVGGASAIERDDQNQYHNRASFALRGIAAVIFHL